MIYPGMKFGVWAGAETNFDKGERVIVN